MYSKLSNSFQRRQNSRKTEHNACGEGYLHESKDLAKFGDIKQTPPSYPKDLLSCLPSQDPRMTS